ncbi:helix-turn-helix domain-containing protein [Streptomyces cupreus]|uniref:Helix-turn-helix domain-containing protein n=1 Tax=Streptomyces cupreus TaxID=2759956 RepID=A0A7X1J8T0_9ACTN|nr:helix-turn-helix domain-containing protein [Streptomyces cupreus]MBC2906226.1 helix-turn-helix domain-containing protein [Streptomyces cupreus]
MSDAQKLELWGRWKAGESISEISRALGRPPGSIFTILKSNGGYVPPVRRRRSCHLTPAEREQISRGLARGDSMREIARTLGRAASISREIARNKGPGATGPLTPRTVPGTARDCPKPCLLAVNQPAAGTGGGEAGAGLGAGTDRRPPGEELPARLSDADQPRDDLQVPVHAGPQGAGQGTAAALAIRPPDQRNIHNTVSGQ